MTVLRPRIAVPSVLSLLALSSCAVGPDYAPPQPTVAAAWLNTDVTTELHDAWWETLGDPALDALVVSALRDGRDMDEADARLREARAAHDAVAARRTPQVGLGGAATDNRLSANGQLPVGRVPGLGRDLSLYDAGFDAAWEIDLWGATGRAVESAEARVEAAVEARRGIILQLVAEVVRAYIDLRVAEALLDSARTDLETQTALVRVIQARVRAGTAAPYDLVRARAQARSVEATLPGLASDADAAVYRLAVLGGEPPEALQYRVRRGGALPWAPGDIGVGLPSDLLRRRPDVRRAERELAAATADIGVATADLFPRVSLLGAVGVQAQDPDVLFSPDSLRFQVGPTVRWSVFTAGRVRSQIRAADARAEAALARYERAVLQALADSETALNRYAAASRTLAARDAGRAEAREALQLAQRRYGAGEDDLTAVLQAQSTFTAMDRAALQARAAQLHQAAALYKSLGGGWQTGEVIRSRAGLPQGPAGFCCGPAPRG